MVLRALIPRIEPAAGRGLALGLELGRPAAPSALLVVPVRLVLAKGTARWVLRVVAFRPDVRVRGEPNPALAPRSLVLLALGHVRFPPLCIQYRCHRR